MKFVYKSLKNTNIWQVILNISWRLQCIYWKFCVLVWENWSTWNLCMLILRHKPSTATPSAWLPKQPNAEPAHSERPGRIPSRQTSRPTRQQQRHDGAPNTSGGELVIKNESDPHVTSELRLPKPQLETKTLPHNLVNISPIPTWFQVEQRPRIVATCETLHITVQSHTHIHTHDETLTCWLLHTSYTFHTIVVTHTGSVGLVILGSIQQRYPPGVPYKLTLPTDQAFRSVSCRNTQRTSLFTRRCAPRSHETLQHTTQSHSTTATKNSAVQSLNLSSQKEPK